MSTFYYESQEVEVLGVKGWQQLISSKKAKHQQKVKIRLGIAVHALNPSYSGGRGSRITVPG
jgi:hypothetical protein